MDSGGMASTSDIHVQIDGLVSFPVSAQGVPAVPEHERGSGRAYGEEALPGMPITMDRLTYTVQKNGKDAKILTDVSGFFLPGRLVSGHSARMLRMEGGVPLYPPLFGLTNKEEEIIYPYIFDGRPWPDRATVVRPHSAPQSKPGGGGPRFQRCLKKVAPGRTGELEQHSASPPPRGFFQSVTPP